jgi:YVTN family beta-propeller protein
VTVESERRAEGLPSGAVTFLFTDVEGSTRLVKALRERYHAVLAEHQDLLRGAWKAHRGYEVDTQGDSFFVAFFSAREAVLAAVQGQAALLSHRWPDGVEVKVRMGIHTGQAVITDGRYTGLAVHRAARICAAGHGGQVLVSQATQTLLDDEEEQLGVHLRDLGEFRLKDLDRPVRLFQAEAHGLSVAFPPLRTAGTSEESEAPATPRRWRRSRILAVTSLAVVCAAAATAFVLTRGSSPADEPKPNHVGLIDPETDKVVGVVPVGSGPGPLASGGGSVWVANLGDRTITRIGIERRTRAVTVPLDARTPTGIAFGAGALWVAHGPRGQLSRVDPHSNRVTKTIGIADAGSNRGAVAVGSGSVWAVYGDSTLARVAPDPDRPRVLGATFAGSSPAGVVVAAGFVWVVNAGDATVTRFEPKSYEAGATGRPIRVGRKPIGIAAGEGAIWVADSADNAVTRINPSTGSTSRIGVGRRPTAVAVGGGLVWVANSGDGTVSRIDPVSNELTGTTDLGNAPSGVVFAGGLVWVAVRAG